MTQKKTSTKKTTRKTTTARKPGPMVPQPHGGSIYQGAPANPKAGPGRTPGLIRAGLREPIPVEVKKLEDNVKRIEKLVAEYEALDRRIEGVTESSAVKLERDESRIRQFITLQERLMVARKELLDYRAKYGLGTTQTATDDDGNALPLPTAIAITLVRPKELSAPA